MSEEQGFSDEDRQQVAQSLESIVRIVLRKELVTLRDSIADVDSRLSERVDSATSSAESRIDQMRDHVVPGFEELRSRMNEADEARERSMAELDDRLAQATSSMKDEMRGIAEALDEPKREVGSLKQRLEDSQREIEALRQELNESQQANATLIEAAGKTENEIEALREELKRPGEQIEALREEMRRPNEQLEALKVAVEEPKQQLKSIQDELRSLTDRLQDIAEQSDNRIEVVKATLEQEIAGGDASLMEQLNGIVGDFNELQNQMTQQTQTSQHLSGVLNNLASIFTSQRGGQMPSSISSLPGPGPMAPAAEVKPSKVEVNAAEGEAPSARAKTGDRDAPAATEGGNSELENALNRVFPLEG
jgi:chromosome segregation ATPase